jgi:hypothetical protein
MAYTGFVAEAPLEVVNDFLKTEADQTLTTEDLTGIRLTLKSEDVSKDANFVYFIDPITNEERLITQDPNKNWIELLNVAGGPENVVMWATGGSNAEIVLEYQYIVADDPSSAQLVVRFREASIYGSDFLPRHDNKLAVEIKQSKASAGGLLLKPSLERNVIDFEIVTTLELNKMSMCTLEDFQSGKYTSWLHSIVDKEANLSNDPSKIDMKYNELLPFPIHQLLTTRGATEFTTFCKISLEPFGYPGKVGIVASTVWEDKNGETAIISTLHTIDGAKLLWDNGWFQDKKGHRICPSDGLGSPVLDKQWITGKPGGEEDYRKIVLKFFESQGYTKAEATTLLKEVADTDEFSEVTRAKIEAIIWVGHGAIATAE